MFRRLTASCLALVALTAACGGADGGGALASSTTAAAPETTTTTTPVDALTILVTNDDGIGAPGIDALVNALQALDDVEIVIVAPAENQSGSSDKTTDGPVASAPGATASGVEGTAVSGFPADSVNVALDEIGIEPDLVVSGVNEGQNIANLAPISGTLGAARTALRRGVPAVAASAGLGELADFDAGAALIVEWVTEHRDALAGGSVGTETVTSFNVPGCVTGEAKALVEVPLAPVIPEGVDAFSTANCDAPVPVAPRNDVEALLGGYLAVTQVPADL